MPRFLICHDDGETAGGGSSSVLLPDLGKIFAQGSGVDAGAGDVLPSDLECASGDGVGVVLSHVCLDLILDRFNLGIQIVSHLSEFCQFVHLGDQFVCCHDVSPPFMLVDQSTVGTLPTAPSRSCMGYCRALINLVAILYYMDVHIARRHNR